jgi:chorismate dehydratase
VTLRIASVPFVNAAPLVDWFGDEGADRVALTRELPSLLTGLLQAGRVDVALLPLVQRFRGQGSVITSDAAIATGGAVESVKLFARRPVSELVRIGIDRASRTSSALLRVLLAEDHGIWPELVETRPTADGQRPEGLDGLLVIGDRCFAVERRFLDDQAPPDVWDLGAWWQRLTGLPFVFAVWVASDTIGGDAGRLGEARVLLERARQHGLAHVGDIAREQAAAGRSGPGGDASEKALYYYFTQCLRYTLGEREWTGMRLFHELCVRHGLVPPGFPPAPAV